MEKTYVRLFHKQSLMDVQRHNLYTTRLQADEESQLHIRVSIVIRFLNPSRNTNALLSNRSPRTNYSHHVPMERKATTNGDSSLVKGIRKVHVAGDVLEVREKTLICQASFDPSNAALPSTMSELLSLSLSLSLIYIWHLK